MGDFRAECHITFDLNGVKDELHMDWVNWDVFGDGVDERVREFFKKVCDKARDEFYASVDEYEEKQKEKEEKQELERLKKKYENNE